MSKHLDHGTTAPAELASEQSWLRIQTDKRRKDLERVVRHTRILSLALKHPRVPWHAKLVAGCAVGYLVSPIQIVPTFIPIIGQLDDLLVLFIGMKLLRKLTPRSVLAECEERAKSPIFLRRKSIDCEVPVVAEKPSSIPAA